MIEYIYGFFFFPSPDQEMWAIIESAAAATDTALLLGASSGNWRDMLFCGQFVFIFWCYNGTKRELGQFHWVCSVIQKIFIA